MDLPLRRCYAVLQRRPGRQDREITGHPGSGCADPQIIFNTKNQIGRELGILLAWIVFSFITISVSTWLLRRKSVNQHRREVAQNSQVAEKRDV